MTEADSVLGTRHSEIQPSTQNRVRTIRNSVRSLALSHFRNYHTERFDIDASRSVVLVGPNGAGKTNMLEAVSLLTPGRGLRRASLGDMDNNEDHLCWSVSAEVEGLQGVVQVGTGRDPEGGEESNKRIVRMDGKNARAQSDLAKVFAVLWLTPQMDNLFIEGGTERRKFLDRLVYSFDDEHASRVNAYESAMRERNRLLAQGKAEGRADPLWLGALEHKMAEQGVAITVARQQAVEGVMAAMAKAGHHFPKAGITLNGTLEQLLTEQSALNAEESFRAILARGRGADAQAGRALAGVHRSQLDVIHLEKNMQAERCSTGEQKALLVSIILAQANAGATWHGRIPVLLLDEVSTHLDISRRRALYEALEETRAQCWLTGTDADTFSGFNAQLFQINSGNIVLVA